MVSNKTIKMNNERDATFSKQKVDSSTTTPCNKFASKQIIWCYSYVKILLTWVSLHCFYTFVHLVSVSNQVDAHFS